MACLITIWGVQVISPARVNMCARRMPPHAYQGKGPIGCNYRTCRSNHQIIRYELSLTGGTRIRTGGRMNC